MPKKNITRREFLKFSGIGIAGNAILRSPAFLLFDAITRGLMDRAIAAEAGITPKRWVDFRLDTAPPRWMADTLLQTTDADAANFLPNKQVATRYIESGGRYLTPVYSTISISGLRFPWIWQFDMPTVGGGTKPMKSLLNNFLNVRGIYTGNSGHAGNIDLHYAPLGAPTSLPALSADYSSKPISAAYYSVVAYLFRCRTGKSPSQVANGGNLINNILKPVIPSSNVATVSANEQLVETYMAAARTALANEALSRHPDSALAKQSMIGARDLIHQSWGDLNQVWTALLAKYTDLINRSLAMTIPGVNDKPIGSSSGTRDISYQLGDGYILKSSDLRDLLVSTSKIVQMAESFALAEFILLNNLSDSITAAVGSILGLKDETKVLNLGHDQHFIGAMAGTYLNSMHMMAQAACLNELISKLPASTWQNTVINVSGEMLRSPSFDGSGSDHSATANLALYSGCIQGPMVLGNIVATSGSTKYPGTIGMAGTQPELHGRIEPGHAHNTVATLLGVPETVAARPSLVSLNNGVASANVAPGKILV